ncbi:bifunctional bis(5'-adenosyl)-triphosphatase/adenylylsulfatase FHIT isoform X2 [Quercus suber]|uniref:bifunctional bis(5'-adenosyl)-triphosphatase/adenylylsulfatase FHIT isoform X2 n=1 Tax=Quercus suber TaxID=58331 RepID=UPI000CE1C753|nr:bifunctional bis(5'-adenosyl)-triphosphatase/adenylylsulfatase FHIT isoform X2 [Quercus suber]POE57534.1 bifunctional bis(5'-adenosyl)-triphosphatase/adenylylsulfatase fhit [Quercus suber]
MLKHTLLPSLSLASRPGWFITHTSVLRPISTTTNIKMSSSEHYMFGPYKIHQNEVFYSTQLSYAFVNLRPAVPAQKIGSQLECYHKASSLTFTIQDGPQAGQTVPHVHVHILPRKVNDFENNDEIYDAIDEKEKELKQKLDLDKERKDRNPEEMSQEADEYRKLF